MKEKEKIAIMPIKYGVCVREASLARIEGQRSLEPGRDTRGKGGQGGKRERFVGGKADCAGSRERPTTDCFETIFTRHEP